MKLLLIIHATSWSDKYQQAKNGIDEIITSCNHEVIEIIQARKDIYDKRYLTHQGKIYTHDEISPVNFIKHQLFGDRPLIPNVVEEIILCGGVFNTTGGGCFNVLFDYLVNYLVKNNIHCNIIIPLNCLYYESKVDINDSKQVIQYIKDLICKLTLNNADFNLYYDRYKTESKHPLINVYVIQIKKQ